MATISFFRDMIINTDEASDNLWRAFEEADSGKPGIDFSNAQDPIEDDEEIRKIMMKWKQKNDCD